MNFLSKITFKNIAKCSLLFFTYGLFPLIALMLFYNSALSVLGLLFSYISVIGIVFVMNILILVKDKFFIIADLISKKINAISDEKMSKYAKNGVKLVGLLISITIVYLTLSLGSLFLNFISVVSVLNPLMIVALNIYYVIMALVFTGYSE